jgi:hypothetical protein
MFNVVLKGTVLQTVIDSWYTCTRKLKAADCHMHKKSITGVFMHALDIALTVGVMMRSYLRTQPANDYN